MAIAGKMIMDAGNIATPGPNEPGLFSLSDPELLKELLSDAGFIDMSVTMVNTPFRVSKEIDFVEFLKEAPDMLVFMFNRLKEDDRMMILGKLRNAFSQFQDLERYTFPAEFLIVSGTKPE